MAITRFFSLTKNPAAWLVFLPALFSSNLTAQTLSFVTKNHIQQQTSNSAPVNVAYPYASISGYLGPYQVQMQGSQAGAVTGPRGGYPLSSVEPYDYQSPAHTSQALLDNAYPNGGYKLTDGHIVNLTGNEYPTAPQLLLVNGIAPLWNSSGQLVLDPTIQNTLTWGAFPTAYGPFSKVGFVEAAVKGNQDSVTIHSMAAGPLGDVAFNTLILAANTLTTGNTYSAYIDNDVCPDFVTVWNNAYDFSEYVTENDFTILAVPPSGTYDGFAYTFANGQGTITNYTGPGGAVEIPSSIYGLPVTSIGYEAFAGRTSLTSVTIPSSVTSIGSSAFFYCTSLTSVTIPDNVTSIGEDAFQDCFRLSSVTIPNGVISIAAGTFASSGLSVVTIPNSVTSIGDYAFDSSNLRSVTIPGSVTSLGYAAFQYCTFLNSVTIQNGITGITNATFFGCSNLTSVTIPNSVATIGGYAFEDCFSLSSVTIPNSVTSIGEDAFSYCNSLTSVKISNSATSIGEGAFLACTALTKVTIPNSVTTIGGFAFANCFSLSSVTIPSSVTSIGVSAFSYCTMLSHVTIPNRLTSLEDTTFYNCTSLDSVTIPASVTSIGIATFEYCGFSHVTIPSHVISIGQGAFYCSGITNAVFDGNAPMLAQGVFAFSLSSVVIVKYYKGAKGFTKPIWMDVAGDSFPTVELTPASQTITFPAIGNQTVGASFNLNATASSGLPISYTSTGSVKITGGKATVIGVGLVRIRASQPGDGAHAAAPSVLNSFNVTIGGN